MKKIYEFNLDYKKIVSYDNDFMARLSGTYFLRKLL